MIKTIWNTLVIMLFLGVLLFIGLFAPPIGKKVVDSTMAFLKWRPTVKKGPLNETESVIKEFDSSFKSLRSLRSMVVSRNKQNTDHLEQTYKEVRSNLKQLLLEMDQQTVTNRAKLFATFQKLHVNRRQLVEMIINDERSLIALNEQMDTQLLEISNWLTQQALEPPSPTKDEMTRGQQYRNLLNDLKAFSQQSNDLNVLRVVLMRKSQDFVNQLEASNQRLETSFSALSSQIEIATNDQAQGLWKEYERLEKEQRDIVAGMRLNQDFIGDNQLKLTTGVSTIAKNIRYRSNNQLQRFQQNFEQLSNQRSAAMSVYEQRRKTFLNAKLTMEKMKETNEFRSEDLKSRTDQMLLQAEKLDEYRRSLSSVLKSMTDELRDNDDFLAQQIEDMHATGGYGNSNEKINEALLHNLDQMKELRNRMESSQAKLEELMQGDFSNRFGDTPPFSRLKELQTQNHSSLEILQQGEDQLRSSQERQKETIVTLQERIRDLSSTNEDRARQMKERAEDQKRMQNDHVADQMQRLRDQQSNRR